MSIRLSLAVALGAIGGCLSRYLLGFWLEQNVIIPFPIATFVVNISGCFLMGFISSLTPERWGITPELRLLLTTGYLGSYTTFSTYQLETVNLIIETNWLKAGLYWFMSPILGIIGFSLGTILAPKSPPIG